jgi:SAM-dependent methyltransferase
MDAFESFKAVQKQGWVHFVPLEAFTTPSAAQLVKRAGIHAGQRVLDVACGTGVVAITAARLGAQVTGLDLTPELLERARENAGIAEVSVEWREGDAEKLPFADASFDAVLSQFGHMFAPRAELALSEMLRVLKPGGTIAFSTWPPEQLVGRSFGLLAQYLPPAPMGLSPPPQWGDPKIVEQRLGAAVSDVVFYRGTMQAPALSPQHYRANMERSAGPMRKLVEALAASDPAKLAQFRREFEMLASEYIHDNIAVQDYLITRARKV